MRTSFAWAAVSAAAIAAALPASAQETVEIDGSSTVYPIVEAVAEEFQAENPDVQVTVGISGTGGGFQRLCRGETDISSASRPIRPSEREACQAAGIDYVEMPVALDALTVVVNPGNTFVDHLTVDELRRIWEPAAQERITSWSQVREGFPDQPLTLYGAGTDSGTYDYFTAAIVGEEGASRGDFTASEDDNVLVQGIANDPNALGFFGLAYYVENQDKLTAVPIVAEEGAEPVEPSLDTARDGSYQPLSRPLFIYVSARSLETKPAVVAFVEFFLDPEIAAALVEEVGYVPLPAEAYELAAQHFENRVTGTAFGEGSQVGISIDDILAAERAD